jgi:hypothetical protein
MCRIKESIIIFSDPNKEEELRFQAKFVGCICGAVGLTITIASFVKSAKDMRSGAISFEKFCVKKMD